MLGKENGVTICDKHSFHDFGLIMTNKVISGPVPKTKKVEVPARNGSIDMTDVVTDDVKYEDRTINISFFAGNDLDALPAITSKIQAEWSGAKTKIIFDDDEAFYWLGRIDGVEPVVTNGKSITINVTATVNPYKYSVQSTMDDWLWDPFDFDTGIINELADLKVNGLLSVELMGVFKYDNPIVISDSEMTVTHNGVTADIKPGSQVLYDIVLSEGTNTLTFTGNGTVSINYVGGSL